MTPAHEEERDDVERYLYLLLGIVVVVVNVAFGVLAMRGGAWKLAAFLLGVGVASAVATRKYWRCGW